MRLPPSYEDCDTYTYLPTNIRSPYMSFNIFIFHSTKGEKTVQNSLSRLTYRLLKLIRLRWYHWHSSSQWSLQKKFLLFDIIPLPISDSLVINIQISLCVGSWYGISKALVCTFEFFSLFVVLCQFCVSVVRDFFYLQLAIHAKWFSLLSD